MTGSHSNLAGTGLCMAKSTLPPMKDFNLWVKTMIVDGISPRNGSICRDSQKIEEKVCDGMKRKNVFSVAIALVLAVCLVLAWEKTCAAEKLFILSPTYSGYFPSSGKTKDAFGSSWTGFGVALNLESLGINTSVWGFHPYSGYFHADEGDNDAHIIPLGLEYRRGLSENIYFGIGASVNAVKFEVRDKGIDTGWRGAVGARLGLGMNVTKWFNIHAAYNFMSEVKDYDFSGFSIQGKVNFYF